MARLFSRLGSRKPKSRKTPKVSVVKASPINSEAKQISDLKRFLNTTSKCLIWFFAVNSVLWIWCSYILAWFGRGQIAESLSSNVCSVIIGGLITYLVTKTIENVFKYNDIGGPRSYVPSSSVSEKTTWVPNAEVSSKTGTTKVTTTTTTTEETENVEYSQSFN